MLDYAYWVWKKIKNGGSSEKESPGNSLDPVYFFNLDSMLWFKFLLFES